MYGLCKLDGPRSEVPSSGFPIVRFSPHSHFMKKYFAFFFRVRRILRVAIAHVHLGRPETHPSEWSRRRSHYSLSWKKQKKFFLQKKYFSSFSGKHPRQTRAPCARSGESWVGTPAHMRLPHACVTVQRKKIKIFFRKMAVR